MNKRVVQELETLFDYVPPERLRELITEVFFNHLQKDAIESESPDDFRKMAGDFYFLIRFLEIAEKYRTKRF
jgi:hypothetical protein